jgi:dolichol kinase
MAVAVTLAAFGALLAGVELIQRQLGLPAEVPRKAVHIGSAVLAAALSFFLSSAEIAVLGLAFAAFMLVSRRLGLLSSVHDVDRLTRGEVFFPLGIAALAIVAQDRTQFVYAVLVLGFADGLAGAIGKRYGRRPLTLAGTRKSVEGSATFFIVATLIGSVALYVGGRSLQDALAVSLLAAVALTGVELALRGGLDNLCVPVVAALLLHLAR